MALTPPILASRLLWRGRLFQPIALSADVGVDYRLVFADGQVQRRSDVTPFADWLSEGLSALDTEHQ